MVFLQVSIQVFLVVALVGAEFAVVKVAAEMGLHVFFQLNRALVALAANGALVCVLAVAVIALHVVPVGLFVGEDAPTNTAHQAGLWVVIHVHVLWHIFHETPAYLALVLVGLLVHIQDVALQGDTAVDLHAANIANVLVDVEMNVEDVLLHAVELFEFFVAHVALKGALDDAFGAARHCRRSFGLLLLAMAVLVFLDRALFQNFATHVTRYLFLLLLICLFRRRIVPVVVPIVVVILKNCIVLVYLHLRLHKHKIQWLRFD